MFGFVKQEEKRILGGDLYKARKRREWVISLVFGVAGFTALIAVLYFLSRSSF